MILSRRINKVSAEVSLPFIWDNSAASDRLKASLYAIMPGFRLQVILRG